MSPIRSPWWAYVPAAQRRRRRWEILGLRCQARLARKDVRILISLGFYGVLCLVPLALGLPALAGVAVLPLLLVPPVGYLAYWLVWQEYHR